jgi:hypothetical protein
MSEKNVEKYIHGNNHILNSLISSTLRIILQLKLNHGANAERHKICFAMGMHAAMFQTKETITSIQDVIKKY